jgi:hypothetical protein
LRVVAQRVPTRKKQIVFRVPEEMRYNGGEMTEEQIKALEQYRIQQHTIELEKEGKPLKQIVHRDVGIREYQQAREEYISKLKAIGVDPRYVGKIERN